MVVRFFFVSGCVWSLDRQQTSRRVHILSHCGGFTSASLSLLWESVGFIYRWLLHGSSVSVANTQVGVRLQRGMKGYCGNVLLFGAVMNSKASFCCFVAFALTTKLPEVCFF